MNILTAVFMVKRTSNLYLVHSEHFYIILFISFLGVTLVIYFLYRIVPCS